MTHAARAVTLMFSAPLLASACTLYFRPDHPLRASSGPTGVDVRKVDLRRSDLDVTLSDPRPGATIDGAWIVASSAPDGAACARNAAAKKIQLSGSSDAGATYVLHFDRTRLGSTVANAPIDDNRLTKVLQNPSTLEVRVASRDESPRCLSLPISGEAPELHWTLEPWRDNPLFVGRGIRFWFPVGSSRYTTFAGDWIVLRLGRWWGPVRIGAGAGVGTGWGSSANPRGAFVLPAPISAEVFPLVGTHVALGLIAGYDLRPSFFQNSGFELIHGPSAGVEIAWLPVALPGFLKGPRAATIGLAATVARWLPDGGATVIGVALNMN